MTGQKHLLTISFTVFVLLCALSVVKAQVPATNQTGSISGHVLIGGKPAAGVDVGAFGRENNRRLPASQSKTDAEGFYRLIGLGAGTYQVTTLAPNLTPAEPVRESNSGFPFYGSSLTVELAAGEGVEDIDFELVRGGVITGRVTNAENQPLVDELVRLQPVQDSGDRMPRVPSMWLQMYQTDDRGIYRIYGLAAGRYRVSVGVEPEFGFGGSGNGYLQQTFHPDVTDPSRANIIELLPGAEVANVDIKVGPPLETYSLSGRFIDVETGLPISGLGAVIMIQTGSRGSSSLSNGNVSGKDGKFSIQDLRPGRYSIYASADFGSEYFSDPITVEIVDKDLTGLEIKAGRGLSISGSIVGDTMPLKDLLKDLPGLAVYANVSAGEGHGTPNAIQSYRHVNVAPNGSFVISGLRAGRAHLSVTSSNPVIRPSVVKVTAGGVGVTQGFDLEPGQSISDVQIVVTYGTGAIRGTVTFQGGPPPPSRVEIICRRDESRTFAAGVNVDTRGRFLITGLSPGTYDCSTQLIPQPGAPARRPPQSQHQSVVVANGTESELNFFVDVAPTLPGYENR